MTDMDWPGAGEQYRSNYLPPFRSLQSGPHLVKHDDPMHRQPQVVGDARVRVFDLAKPEDLEALNAVLQRVGLAGAHVQSMDKHYSDETGSWKILLIWQELYRELPDETHARRAAFYRGEACL